MAGPYDLTGQNIENTYQRVVQTPDGINYYDGTGSLLPLSSSFISGASAVGSTITFTRGDGSTFPVTVAAGTGTPGGSNTNIQFNSASVFSGSSNFSFDYVNSNLILTGSLLVTSSHISTVDYVDFSLLDLTQQPAQNEGRLFWNSDSKTLQLDLDQNFYTELNQQLIVRVVNKTGDNLPIGTVVYISGSQGNRPGIATASWTGDQTSAATIGFTAKAINNNNNGYVLTRGILVGVNTAAYPVGTPLYLSSSGQFTNTPPDAPLHEVRLGKVIVSDATVGSIYVDVMNGYELTELHDVKTTGYSDGDLLIQSGALWINSKTLTGSYTLSGSLTTNGGISVQTLTASFVSASGGITGSLFGTASVANIAYSASIIANNTTNANYYLPFTDRLNTAAQTGSVQLQTDNGLYYNPNTNILTTIASNVKTNTPLPYPTNPIVTSYPILLGSINFPDTVYYTSSIYYDAPTNIIIGTASNATSASYAISASWAPSAGGGTSGGSNKSIQYNTGSLFGGDSVLTYDYDSSSATKYQLKLNPNLNFTSSVYTTDSPGSLIIQNDPTITRRYPSLTSFIIPIAANGSKEPIINFRAINSGKLAINGFKCDYSLDANDGSYYGSRVGTLMCSLNNDNTIAINVVDSSITGDTTLNLSTAIFYAEWNGDDVNVEVDFSNINYNGVFTGLFTFFNNIN